MILKTKFSYFPILILYLLLISCGKSETLEDEPLALTCPVNILVNLNTSDNGAVVTYDTPKNTNNITILQTAGLSSGVKFPLGTTTNTFRATNTSGTSVTCSFTVEITNNSENTPFFIGENPTPAAKKWVKVDDLSDEFNDDSFDTAKWQNTDANRWRGRAPGIFKENTVTEADGNLRLTAYKLDAAEEVKGETFTHAGSNIYSKKAANVGMYLECRMKANKTFMSSTFWLINDMNEGTDCDKRSTELDIQECVGQVTGTGANTKKHDETINSNTHSRRSTDPTCISTPIGSIGNNSSLDGKVWEDYFVYAAWWKSATEVEFYLNGVKVYTINPKANFNLPMYVRMVVETYNWNPVPADGGMTGSVEDRTTYYDWIRTWELQDN